MNSVNMTGRIVDDLTIYEKVVRFRIAVKKDFKREGEPDSDFFQCKAFGKTKDFIENWIRKGIKVEITGRLENERAVSSIDGKTTYKDVIAVEKIGFAESKKATIEAETATVTPTVREGFSDLDADQVELPFN